MAESVLQLFVAGLFLALLGFELTVALLSWAEARGTLGGAHRRLVWIPRPVTIRSHLDSRRHRVDSLRWQYPVLRTNRHAHELRAAIRGLPRHAVDRVRARPVPLSPRLARIA